MEEVAEKTGLTSEKIKDALESACKKLFAVREKRPRPHLDNKMITAWNGEAFYLVRNCNKLNGFCSLTM